MCTITASFQLCFFSASHALRSEFPPQSLRLPKCSFNLHDFSDHYFFKQFNFFFSAIFHFRFVSAVLVSTLKYLNVYVKWKIIGKNFPFWHYVFPFNLVSMKKETYSFNRLFCNIESKFSIFINRLWVGWDEREEVGCWRLPDDFLHWAFYETSKICCQHILRLGFWKRQKAKKWDEVELMEQMIELFVPSGWKDSTQRSNLISVAVPFTIPNRNRKHTAFPSAQKLLKPR